MLIRRFTIVCLMTALFGAGLSILVAEISRPSRTQHGIRSLPCQIEDARACATAASRR